MQPQEQPIPQIKQSTNKKFLIPIIILSILVLSLGGWLIFDKLISPSINQNTSTQNENTGNTTQISAAAFEKDKELYKDGIISAENLSATHHINDRYPEYQLISDPMFIFVPYAVNNNGHISGTELFNKIANQKNGDISYLFTYIFKEGYNHIFRPSADITIESLFGATNVEDVMRSAGFTVEPTAYTLPGGGIGGDCFPMTFLSGITKTETGTILNYNYATARNGTYSCDHYAITHKLQVTLTSNGSTEIQIKSIDIIE